MGWVDELRGTKVGIDTSPLIYFIEQHVTYLPLVRPFFVALDQGEFQAVTSVITRYWRCSCIPFVTVTRRCHGSIARSC